MWDRKLTTQQGTDVATCLYLKMKCMSTLELIKDILPAQKENSMKATGVARDVECEQSRRKARFQKSGEDAYD